MCSTHSTIALPATAAVVVAVVPFAYMEIEKDI